MKKKPAKKDIPLDKRQQTQALVDLASFLLLMHGAHQIGLIRLDHLIVDAEKCEQIIAAAKTDGIEPVLGRIQPFDPDFVRALSAPARPAAVRERITDRALGDE